MDLTLGLGLIIVGIVLLFVEMSTPGFFIAIPGTVLIVVGIVISLVNDPVLALGLSVVAIIPVTAGTIMFYRKLSPEMDPMTPSKDSLLGKNAIVTVPIKPDTIRGKVKIENTIWSATAKDEIEEGAKVVVVASKGVHVTVERVQGRKVRRKAD